MHGSIYIQATGVRIHTDDGLTNH